MTPARLEREARRAEETLVLERAANRRWRWYVVAGAAVVLAGIVMSGSAFAVTDPEIGNVLLLAGMTLGNVGVLAVVMVYNWNSDSH
jgi:hypothetical protein